MRIAETPLPGLLELLPEVKPDERGWFVKTYERDAFEANGLPTEFAEELHTFSRAGVLRGLHFQTPPHAQAKVVFCEAGSIFDVVVDLRRGSPAYGVAATFELTAERGNGLYVPEGFAHGFCVTAESAVVAYRITAGYAPAHDTGIRWDSVGVDWPVSSPLTSPRDAAFPALADFDTPFAYEPGR